MVSKSVVNTILYKSLEIQNIMTSSQIVFTFQQSAESNV